MALDVPHPSWWWKRAACLSEAERLAAGDSEQVRRRVALARLSFRFAEGWTEIHGHAARREWAAALAAGEEAIRRLRKTAGTEPQTFWIDLAVAQTQDRDAAAVSRGAGREKSVVLVGGGPVQAVHPPRHEGQINCPKRAETYRG